MEMKKEQEEKRNYTTPILAAILILLIIASAVGFYIKGQSKPVRKRTIHRPAGIVTQVEKKTAEPVKNVSIAKETPKTEKVTPKPQPVQPKAKQVTVSNVPTTSQPEKYVKLFIYSNPPARIYIDHTRIVDEKGNDVITPVKNLRVKAGTHIIKLVAKDNPSKVWWTQQKFYQDDMIYVDTGAGDW